MTRRSQSAIAPQSKGADSPEEAAGIPRRIGDYTWDMVVIDLVEHGIRGIEWTLVVLVHEDDFTMEIKHLSRIAVLTSFTIITVAIVLIATATCLVKRALSSLKASLARIADVDLENLGADVYRPAYLAEIDDMRLFFLKVVPWRTGGHGAGECRRPALLCAASPPLAVRRLTSSLARASSVRWGLSVSPVGHPFCSLSWRSHHHSSTPRSGKLSSP